MSPPLCPLCRMPAHASETNDRDEYPECARRERARRRSLSAYRRWAARQPTRGADNQPTETERSS